MSMNTSAQRPKRITALGYLLAASLLVAFPSSAQQTLLGLPLNGKAGSWARYVADSSEGPISVVIRVQSEGRFKGRTGRWYAVEVEPPGLGRISMRFLIRGSTATPDNVIAMESTMGGGKPKVQQMTDKDRPPPEEATALTRVKGGEVQVAGQPLPFDGYRLSEGVRAGWSSKVPAFGLVFITGESRMALVAYGASGDPWKDADDTALWPQWYTQLARSL